MEQTQVVKEETQAAKTQEVESQETPKGETDLDAVMKRLEMLEGSNERLESESKKWKSRYKELESTNEEAKRERLEQEGKWQELLELEKNKNMQAAKSMQELKRQALDKELGVQVARYAKDAIDLNDVVYAVKTMGEGIVEIDPDNMTISGVQDAIALIREKKAHFFDQGRPPGQVSSRPMSQVPQKKSLAEMTMAEKNALLKEVFKPPQTKN